MNAKRINAAVLVVAVTLVLAACGGSDDETSSAASAPTTSTDEISQAEDPSDGATSDSLDTDTTLGVIEENFDTAGGAATASIGDETWEFELSEDVPVSVCDSDFFGGFVAMLTQPGADMSQPIDAFSVTLPGGDFTDPPTVGLNLAASGGAEWIADETIYELDADLPAGLGVTAFSIDGTTASGSATFFEQESFYQFNAGTGDLVVADGTFTVTCATGD